MSQPYRSSMAKPNQTNSTPRIRHLAALVGSLKTLQYSLVETEEQMVKLKRLTLAMQTLSGGQAAQFMATSQVVGKELDDLGRMEEQTSHHRETSCSTPAAYPTEVGDDSLVSNGL
ncbi:hypothetical protein [Phaffia rhodozyma]|uniref:Uncharacterized protein n=1 Tax=Phaffia rhodozyma TaxID=264483 RepID=A0A0F7SMB8_PHARH|nr:hypothetical protein [Phaffia rhodozyma]